VLEVTLPRRSAEELSEQSAIVLRIPDAGGFPEADSGQPRGMLLLKVIASAEPDASVVRAKRSILSRDRPPSDRGFALSPRRVLAGAALLLLIVLVVIALMSR
jgi:hypothetical protein